MFLVFNKQKIFSYVIAFTTVIALLGMAKLYTNKSAEIIETFSKAKEEKITEKNEENNDVRNCIELSEKWNDNDVNQLLLILKKYNISMRFYIKKEWKNKHNVIVNQISNYGHEIVEID